MNQEPGLEPEVLCRQHVLKRDRHVTLGLTGKRSGRAAGTSEGTSLACRMNGFIA